MEKGKKKSFVDAVWDFFASIKLAVVIFAVLALTSIIGTVIEQNAEPEKNLKLLAKLFGAGAAPTLYTVSEQLGFMDMYHSWWFITILLLFAANLVICSLERLPKIIKLVKEPVKPLSEDQIRGFSIKREVSLKGRTEKVREEVEKTFQKTLGFKFAESRDEGGLQIYAQKGSFTRLGVYITHVSILVILAGAIAGIFLGFKGFLNLPEGRVYSVAFARTGQLTPMGEAERDRILDAVEGSAGNLQNAARQIGIDEGFLRQKMKQYGIQPLGFMIRCDDFTVDFYGTTDMPKAYRSWLTILKDGQEVKKKMIEVNEPLTFEGVTFYQSSYGMMPNAGGNSTFRMKITSKDGNSEEKALKFGGSFTIPGTSITGTIEDFSPALGFDRQTGKPFTYAQQMSNPAVFISFSEGGTKKSSGWIFKRYPETGRLPDGSIVEFSDLWGIQYTGLQVRRDPGVWIVYLGCLIMAIGLYTAFFMSHRRVWIRFSEAKNATQVIIGASANKNRPSLERKIDKAVTLLSKAPEGGK